jgi:WD40 repeat protein
VLLLDCCHGGAFKEGMLARGTEAAGEIEQLQGNGRVVLTASNALQYSFEGEAVKGSGKRGFFTHFLVEGLETGDADRDGDGRFSIDDIYYYVCDRMKGEGHAQQPEKMAMVEGDLFLGQNPRPKATRLPEELVQYISSNDRDIRLLAVNRLEPFLHDSHQGRALTASEILRRLREDDDSQKVREAAARSLEQAEAQNLAKDDASVRGGLAHERVRAQQEEREKAAVVKGEPKVKERAAADREDQAREEAAKARERVAANQAEAAQLRQLEVKLLATLQGHTKIVFKAEFSPDGARIVTVSLDGTARIWGATDGRCLFTFSHNWPVYGAAFSSDGQRIVTASGDQTARVWDAANGRALVALRGHTASVSDAAFSPDGQRIVTASSDCTAQLWDAASGRFLVILGSSFKPLFGAAFSSDAQRIVASSLEGATVWDAANMETLVHFWDSKATVSAAAAFSPDGQRIVIGLIDGTTRVLDAASGRTLVTLQGHNGAVYAAAFSPDGRRIVTASDDCRVQVWDVSTGQALVTLEGHTGPVYAAAYNRDARWIVSASKDHTARIWDAAKERSLPARDPLAWILPAAASDDHLSVPCEAGAPTCLAMLQGHSSAVHSAVFSPDGTRIVTASADHTARVWQVFQEA